jgi:N-methylhydantoinase B
MAFAYLLDPDCPRNEGAFRPLRVVARPGTIVWAEPGAPVTMCTSHCSNEIVEAVITALAQSCPERAMGGWGRRFRVAMTGVNPRTGRRFIWHMFHGRPGGGASAAGDGWPAAGEWHSVGGIKFGSVEVTEARFPLVLEHHEFREGSGGAGQHRGGNGAELVLRVEADAVANTAGDGVRHGARGVAGGEDGLPHHYMLQAPGAEPLTLRTKQVGVGIPTGSRLHVLSGGGGGWGRA